ncbi:MAG: FAD-binding protein [Clostridiales bacterium]|nr:FAD-binding protein [Clostridiales bacterium]
MYDVIIVGGGPAGSTFARLLSNKYSALLIDKKKTQGGFEKPCGGLLAPKAQQALSTLGDTLPNALLADPQIFAVNTIDCDSGLIRTYPREYVNMDRHKFDMWLLDKVGENVEKVVGTATEITKTGDTFQVKFRTDDGEEKYAESKFLVGADGANSCVRKFVMGKDNWRRYMSIQQWFENANEKPFYACVMDSEITDCYSWALMKNGKFIFGGAYPEKTAKTAFEKQKIRLEKDYGFKFGEPIKTEACFVLRPKNAKSFCFGKDGVFLLGESAGLVSPSGLEGISSALFSGMYLADAFNKNQGGKYEPKATVILKSYVKSANKIKRRLLLKLLKCPPMYQPFLRKLVMKSGLTSIPVIKNP